MSKSEKFKRLPNSVIPKKYFITLQPNISARTFEGNVNIELEAKECVDTITLNAVFLDILKITFEDGNKSQIKSHNLNKIEETLTIGFNSLISVGPCSLYIEFSGSLDNQEFGFFLSKQISAKNEEDYAAVTHFEATYARNAFPCWDEPAFKAEFNITLVVPRTVTALSNMNVISDAPNPEDLQSRIVKFAQTPLMSTYLVAFIVGKFGFIEDFSTKGVTLRVYTPVGKEEQGRFALKVLKKCLSFYEEYFNIDYPLSKLDLIAVSDLPIGAMENWGLVTYKEHYLLVEECGTSLRMKQNVAKIICHEISHQWFGNLVTMEWWTDLWLKEGFARYMEHFCVDHILPDFDIMSSFWSVAFSSALKTDSFANSHPIEVKVENPADINSIFDAISYHKGASLLRMLHHFLGDENFRDGLRYYLANFAHKNTKTEDLWVALNLTSGKSVDKIMTTWTKHKGYPMLFVSNRIEDNNRILTITQKKFSLDSEDLDESQWMIPITFSSNSNPHNIMKKFILDKDSAEIAFENVPDNDWIKVNTGSVGFYRVQYSSEMLERFVPGIQDGTIPLFDRVGLLDDLFALVLRGTVSTVDILQFLKNFAKEESYVVWTSVIQCLQKLHSYLDSSKAAEHFQKFSCALLAEIYRKVGWDLKPNEKETDTLLRSLIIQMLIDLQHAEVLAEAQNRYANQISGSMSSDPNLRAAVYKAIASSGGQDIFEQMIQIHKNAKLQEEKDCITQLLGAFKCSSIKEQALEFSITEGLRSIETIYIIASVSRSGSEGRMLAWNFFQKHVEFFKKCYKPGFRFNYFVQLLIENFPSSDMYTSIKEFFSKAKIPGIDRAVNQGLENVMVNIKWFEKEAEKTHQWLATNC